MAVYFTSDTHFGDHRTLNIRGGRPFDSVAEMDAAMAANWNALVGAEDEVWHLGDFARSFAIAERVLPQLNGHKHLIRGNNDPDAVLRLDDWESVGDYRELEIDGLQLVLCHYPFRSWNRQSRKAINLHGHSHGALKPLPRQIDVGVDPWSFRPVSFEQIRDRTATKRRTRNG